MQIGVAALCDSKESHVNNIRFQFQRMRSPSVIVVRMIKKTWFRRCRMSWILCRLSRIWEYIYICTHILNYVKIFRIVTSGHHTIFKTLGKGERKQTNENKKEKSDFYLQVLNFIYGRFSLKNFNYGCDNKINKTLFLIYTFSIICFRTFLLLEECCQMLMWYIIVILERKRIPGGCIASNYCFYKCITGRCTWF